jgi:hypothetical protein
VREKVEVLTLNIQIRKRNDGLSIKSLSDQKRNHAAGSTTISSSAEDSADGAETVPKRVLGNAQK